MRELVEHDVGTVECIVSAADRIVPGDHHHAVAPRFPDQRLRCGGKLAGAGRVRELGDEAVWIHEHRAKAGIARTLEVEQQEASLRGDCDFDLLGHGETAASFEMFVGEKQLHQAQQPLSLVGTQAASERNALVDHITPPVGDRVARQPQRARADATQHGGDKEEPDSQ